VKSPRCIALTVKEKGPGTVGAVYRRGEDQKTPSMNSGKRGKKKKNQKTHERKFLPSKEGKEGGRQFPDRKMRGKKSGPLTDLIKERGRSLLSNKCHSSSPPPKKEGTSFTRC